jgi:hypothetical protein
MFASQEMPLELSFPVARARLSALTGGGWLGHRSAEAYAAGLAGLVRVGPFGAVLGASKLVRVSLLDPVPRDDQMIIPLRWEATGPAGRLFPVLDANLVLTPGPDADHCVLALVGAYRPPLGAAGAALDRVLLNRAASATIRSLLTSVGESLLPPSPALERAQGEGAEPVPAAETWWPEPETPW